MPPAQRPKIVKVLREFGELLLNFAIAGFVTNILGSEFRFHRDAVDWHLVIKRDLVDAAIAFALGYFVYHRWRFASAKWLWVAGICLFAQRAVRFGFEQHGPLSVLNGSKSLYWEMSGVGCLSDRSVCPDLVYTFTLLRTIFYSAGAWFCLWFRRYESAALPNLKNAILALRRT